MTNLKDKYNNSLIKLNKLKRDFKVLNLNVAKDSKIALSSKSIDIIVLYSEYNLSINKSLLNGYLNNLQDNKYKGIIAASKIPGGAFELPLLTSKIIRKYKPKICLVIGCILKGETQHYEFLSSTVINAIRNVSFDTDTPILNGILTTENNLQAVDRAGKKFNKGAEYARVSIEILNFIKKINV